MSKIKGQNFRILQNQAAIPDATNCSITLQGNTEDVSTKDTEGMYSDSNVVSRQWSAQVDTYQSEVAQLQAVIATFNAAESVTVGWDQTAGDKNRVAQEASFAREGEALLNDFTMTFNDRETVAVSLQFQGTGPVDTLS